MSDERDEEHPRSGIFGWALAAWLLLLVAVTLGMVKCAHAEGMTFKDPKGNSVQLFEEPCFDAPPWLGWHKASMFYEGKIFEACWLPVGKYVLIIDSAGDQTPIPMDAFKKSDGA